MASQYSHLQFFRRVPNELLARYFSSQDVALDLDLTKLKSTEVEPVLSAFVQLDDTRQDEMEAAFQDMHAMACEGGVAALVDEAAFHGDGGFVTELAKLEGFSRQSDVGVSGKAVVLARRYDVSACG